MEFRKRIVISRDLSVVALAASATLLLWIIFSFTVFEIRYVFFLWIMLCIPLAVVIDCILDNNGLLFRIAIELVLVALLIFTAFRIVVISIDTYSPTDTLGNPKCYDIELCDFLRPVNDAASQGDRVLTLNAFRYYLRSDLFACSTTHEEYATFEELSHEDNMKFWTEVYRRGFKYVAYERNYSVRHLFLGIIPNPYNAPPWMTLQPMFGAPGDAEVLYEIRVKKPPIQVEQTCRKNSRGLWEIQPIRRSGN